MLTTERLVLIPADASTVRAAIDDHSRFAALLGARVPPGWPPDLLDVPALEWTLRWLEDPANNPNWGMRWIVLREPRTLVGVCGYKGGPKDATVELGYGVVAEHQRRGYASEAVRALVTHAFEHAEVSRVIAETLPGLIPSIGVLDKCGFTLLGEGSEPGVIRYGKERRQ